MPLSLLFVRRTPRERKLVRKYPEIIPLTLKVYHVVLTSKMVDFLHIDDKRMRIRHIPYAIQAMFWWAQKSCCVCSHHWWWVRCAALQQATTSNEQQEVPGSCALPTVTIMATDLPQQLTLSYILAWSPSTEKDYLEGDDRSRTVTWSNTTTVWWLLVSTKGCIPWK